MPNDVPNDDGSILTWLWAMVRSSHSRVSVDEGFEVAMVKSWCEVMASI